MSCDRTLVAAAVHALCDRDAGDMKAIQSMRHFSPSTHSSLMTSVVSYSDLGPPRGGQGKTLDPHGGLGEDLGLGGTVRLLFHPQQVTFTRCLYAKLLHQRFNPPPHSGFVSSSPTSPTHQAYELGMKLVRNPLHITHCV